LAQTAARRIDTKLPVTRQQFMTYAFVLASDVAMSAAENMRTGEALKRESGLTYRLERNQTLRGKED
jgi:hypothetical protein